MSHVIGIDLGCKASSAAAIVDGRPQLIADRHGRFTFPSCVFMDPDGHALAGDQAMKRGAETPDRLLEGLPRLMGSRYDSPEFQIWRKSAWCGVGKADDGRALISFDDHYYIGPKSCARRCLLFSDSRQSSSSERSWTEPLLPFQSQAPAFIALDCAVIAR